MLSTLFLTQSICDKYSLLLSAPATGSELSEGCAVCVLSWASPWPPSASTVPQVVRGLWVGVLPKGWRRQGCRLSVPDLYTKLLRPEI